MASETQLKTIWQNVRLLGSSARTTLTLFRLGAGDAMVTYEQDARLAQELGVALEIVVPPRTIVAQHVAVIVDDNVEPAEQPLAAHDIVSKGSNGLVVLVGQVPTYTVAEAAETVAASAPGVRTVSNRLQIDPQVSKRSMGFAG